MKFSSRKPHGGVVLGSTLLSLLLLGTTHAQPLKGAGASFPAPLYQRLFEEYEKRTKQPVHYDVQGSSQGQAHILTGDVDFGASDEVMKDTALSKANVDILHVPAALGAVVITYNIPGLRWKTPSPLRLTGPVLADIYLGTVKTWNDPAITRLNPEGTFPNLPITVARRAEGSGTTAVFTEYLSKVSRTWKALVGTGATVNWPVGVAARGNDQMATLVKNAPGVIGYTELTYATRHNLHVASMRNRAGHFINPSPDSVTAAAASVVIPPDTRVSLTDSTAPHGYPLATFTYVLVRKNQQYGGRSAAQARALKHLLTWMVNDGQEWHKSLQYAPLPSNAVTRARALLATLTYGSTPLR